MLAEFLTGPAVQRGLDIMYSGKNPYNNYETQAARLYATAKINYEQVILVRNYTHDTGKTEDELLCYMGLMPNPKTMDTSKVTEIPRNYSSSAS